MRNVNCIKWCGYIIGLLFLLGCTMVVYLSTNLPFLFYGISYFFAKKTARLPIIIDSLALILLLLFLLVIGLMSVTPYE
ncbi:hypothetical protein [Bacillus sp. CBEL-1]|uniref:hypothetical protein n=1 Tax=Bacillus sp. CBEL-1 TaxID=2502980 RepID=UPI00104E24ED|nr:hypothetical protein [Bacillus sp. CBEL-1]TDB52336.1 hypothetical protein EPL02_07780 [Bacillus sp. CBEL-1]